MIKTKDYIDIRADAIRQSLDATERAIIQLQTDAKTHLTIDAYETRHQRLESDIDRVRDYARTLVVREQFDEYRAQIESRLIAMERWQANIMGRAVGFAVIGSIFLATVTAVISHLISI